MKDEQNQTEPLSIEEGFSQLDQIIRSMEGGGQSLEQAFSDYQKGIAMIRQLELSLADMEKQLEVFNKMTGELETQDV
jgi:exodeoxyribonuclease VII small subunit